MSAFIRDPVVHAVIGAAIKVHRALGPGLLESAYQTCLAYEFARQRLEFQRKMPVPLMYGDVRLDCAYRVDFCVCHSVLVEVKSVDRLLPIHDAQVLTYLRLTGAAHLLMFNFNSLTLKEGLKSFVGKGKHVPTPDRAWVVEDDQSAWRRLRRPAVVAAPRGGPCMFLLVRSGPGSPYGPGFRTAK